MEVNLGSNYSEAPLPKLDTTRCVGVMHDTGGSVDEIRHFDGAGNVPINKESQCIRFPIDL